MMQWQNTPPTVDDLLSHGESYYWVQGGLFNRPLMVRVVPGVTSEIINLKRVFRAEVNFTFMAENYPTCIWRPDLARWPGLGQLQWAGPVPRPEN